MGEQGAHALNVSNFTKEHAQGANLVEAFAIDLNALEGAEEEWIGIQDNDAQNDSSTSAANQILPQEEEYSINVNTTIGTLDVTSQTLTQTQEEEEPWDAFNPAADDDIVPSEDQVPPRMSMSDVSSIEVARDASMVDNTPQTQRLSILDPPVVEQQDDSLLDTAQELALDTSLEMEAIHPDSDPLVESPVDVPKRKSTPLSPPKRKRRKIRIDNHQTELSSAALKQSIRDWSGTMRHRTHPADMDASSKRVSSTPYNPSHLSLQHRLGVQVFDMVRKGVYAKRGVEVEVEGIRGVQEDKEEKQQGVDVDIVPVEEEMEEVEVPIMEDELMMPMEEQPEVSFDVPFEEEEEVIEEDVWSLDDLSVEGVPQQHEQQQPSSSEAWHPHTTKVLHVLRPSD